MSTTRCLTADQWLQFELFGFVVLRDWLTPAETEALRSEVLARFELALGPALAERPWMSGMAGHYLPMLTPAAPLTSALVEDARFHAVARDLLDGEVLLSPAEVQAVLYFGETAWHRDSGRPLREVKLVAYLDPLTADTGALRVLPMSHTGDQRRLGHWIQHPRVPIEDVPAFVCETRPGDVVAFDALLYHASLGGSDRLQWSAVYAREPETDEARAALDDLAAEWPTWGSDPFPAGTTGLDPAWIAAPDPSPLKRRWLRRYRELGAIADDA
jgi:hypothetical protein